MLSWLLNGQGAQLAPGWGKVLSWLQGGARCSVGCRMGEGAQLAAGWRNIDREHFLVDNPKSHKNR